MGDTYQYIGGERRGYFAYVDTDTHQMLIAEPGGEYRMRAVDPNDPVPPNDGRWLVDDIAESVVEQVRAGLPSVDERREQLGLPPTDDGTEMGAMA